MTTDPRPRPVIRAGQQRQTAHEFVRETLRRSILTGELPGGMRLVQSELAEQLSVSTTPVREALRDLASDGLLDFDPHRGAIVHELSWEELREVHELRAVLEPLALRRANERISDEELDVLRSLADDMEASGDLAEWLDLNREFHLTIHAVAGSERLRDVLQELQDATTLYIGRAAETDPRLMATSNREHRELIAALQDRDGGRAAEVLGDHIGIPVRTLDEELVHDPSGSAS